MALERDELTTMAPWRRDQGRMTFLDHRHDYPDPLAAARHEARVLAQDNAHLVAVNEALEAAKLHNDAVFLPRIERLLARKNERIARAEALARLCMVAAVVVTIMALALWVVAVGGAY